MNQDVVCRGSYMLGTACGKCRRCKEEDAKAGREWNGMNALRERCEKLAKRLTIPRFEDKVVNVLEAFAREIRNEALEEAAKVFEDCNEPESAEYLRRTLAEQASNRESK